ncbi:hypothetical protein FIBSPDRAFT_937028 [Athelia psychrophila]|uniref:Nephrocystin 3-like N-terminal domain-containing protein n=1 Tax=Athelia psychrophila TaxID=1759441 RepID=A0A166B3X9_9AGAM|nr:hypothetical protein FIBSPDRAFT_937028 [Fibularhizoctonia sp. CBS 109695]
MTSRITQVAVPTFEPCANKRLAAPEAPGGGKVKKKDRFYVMAGRIDLSAMSENIFVGKKWIHWLPDVSLLYDQRAEFGLVAEDRRRRPSRGHNTLSATLSERQSNLDLRENIRHDQNTLLGSVRPPDMLGTRLTRVGASTTSVRSLEMQTPVTSMFCAKSLELQLVDEQLKIGKFANPHHYAVLFIDGNHFNISSTLKIAIFRKRRVRKDTLVAQYAGQGRDFLDQDTKYVLTDEMGSQTDLRLSIHIDLISLPPADFIKSVTDNAAGLQSVGISETAQALGGLGLQIFQILEKIVPAIDAVSNAHPVLKMTWTVLSAAFKAAKSQMDQDASICDLAKSLQEILGVANVCPELARVEDTDDVIAEIRRAALEGALLIAEYVGTTSLAGRTAKHQLSDMSDRITQCQKRYTDLGSKFDRRVQLETHAMAKETDKRVKGIQDVQMEEKIEKWMDAPDTSPNFNAARKKHQLDTGSWFLNGSAFTRWMEHPDILLWLHGGPGCGKTILGAASIQEVVDFCDSRPSTGYASFFFDGRSAEAALLVHEKLVRSIIIQLAHRCDGIPVALAEMYAKCDKGSRQPPIEMLEATLLRIVDSFDDVYIVIDSLDECSERKDLLAWIRSMTSRVSGKLHMMATSRSEPDIGKSLRSVVGLLDVSVIGSTIKADISTFLDKRLAAIEDWNEPGLKELIKDTLLDGSDGMFRWVALQLDQLLECVSREELEQQLKSLPKGLDEAYARIFSRSARPKHLKIFLQFLAFAGRAMTVQEIAEVATVDFDSFELPAYNARLRYTDPSKVVNICYGLVTEVDGAWASS